MFSRTRDKSSITLHRGVEAYGPTGIFTCEVPDDSGVTQKLYFGIYSGLEGICIICTFMSFIKYVIAYTLDFAFKVKFIIPHSNFFLLSTLPTASM